MTLARLCIALLLTLGTALPARAADDGALDLQLSSLAQGYAGKVAFFAQDLATGKTAQIDADVPVPTASVIKLTILFEALERIRSGGARWSEPVTLTKADQVPGSGVLALFDAPQRLTLKDVLTMMIVTSDNTATNVAIDRLGLAAIDRRIVWLGLRDTWLYKKVFMPPAGPMPADQQRFGLGKTTAREMAAVMARFATCDLNAPGVTAAPTPADRALCDVATSMLKHQFDDNSTRRYVSGIEIGNKSGSLDDVRNDVAILYAKRGPIVVSAFTYDNADRSWTPDNAGQLLIGRLTKAVADAWSAGS